LILFIVVTLLLAIIVLIDKTIPKTYIVASYVFLLLLLTLWGIECIGGNIPFFISDENYYHNTGILGLPKVLNRSFWIFVNYWIINNDIYLYGLPLKLINIPIFCFFLIIISKIFNSNKIYYLSILLPYSAWISIFNVRDMAIFLFTALVIFTYYKIKYRFLFVFMLILLFLLRPTSAVLCLGIILSLEAYNFLIILRKQRVKFKDLVISVITILLIAISLIIFFKPLTSQLNSLYSWLKYTTGEGEAIVYSVRMSESFYTGNRIKDALISMVRYVLTPMPHSLVGRIIEGGSERWGILDDIIRLWHQIGYYLLLTYLVLNIRKIKKIIKMLSKMQAVFILAFLAYWPIYSFYLYAGTHQRLKIPFQIVIFIISMNIYNHKNKESGYMPKEVKHEGANGNKNYGH